MLLGTVLLLAACGALAPPTPTSVPPLAVTGPYPAPGSPAPSPTPLPPTPTPVVSEFAQAACAYIAGRYGVPMASLTVHADYPTEYPEFGRPFQVVTLVDSRTNGTAWKLLVDRRTMAVEEDVGALLRAEEDARRDRLGALTEELARRLDRLGDDERIHVEVSFLDPRALDHVEFAAIATVTAMFLEARAAFARGGKPTDVADPLLRERIDKEYARAFDDVTAAALRPAREGRAAPFAEELRARGFPATLHPEWPAVRTELPKRLVLDLARRPDIQSIDLDRFYVPPPTATPTPIPPKPGEVAIPFDLIAAEDGSGALHEDRSPSIAALTSATAAERLGSLVTRTARERLRALDFGREIAVLVLQGWKPSSGFGVEIERVARRGATIPVYARFRQPPPDGAVQARTTTPYALLRIDASGLRGQTVTFELIADGQLVASHTEALP